jgi:hypothetical protein
MRDFIYEQYQRLRQPRFFLPLPFPKKVDHLIKR